MKNYYFLLLIIGSTLQVDSMEIEADIETVETSFDDNQLDNIVSGMIEANKDCACGFNTANYEVFKEHLQQCKEFKISPIRFSSKDNSAAQNIALLLRAAEENPFYSNGMPWQEVNDRHLGNIRDFSRISHGKRKASLMDESHKSGLDSGKAKRKKGTQQNKMSRKIGLAEIYNHHRKMLYRKCACGQAFQTVEQLENHMKDNHTEIIMNRPHYVCPIIGCTQMPEANILVMLDHYSHEHTREKVACFCSQCAQALRDLPALKLHELGSTEHQRKTTQPLTCSYCQLFQTTEQIEGNPLEAPNINHLNQASEHECMDNVLERQNANPDKSRSREDCSNILQATVERKSSHKIMTIDISAESENPGNSAPQINLIEKKPREALPKGIAENDKAQLITYLVDAMFKDYKKCYCGYDKHDKMQLKFHILSHLISKKTELDIDIHNQAEEMIKENSSCYCDFASQDKILIALHLITHMILG